MSLAFAKANASWTKHHGGKYYLTLTLTLSRGEGINKNKNNTSLIIGGVESVYIPPFEIPFQARIDTGAATSSIDAQNITPFERDGEKWISFDIVNKKTSQKIVSQHDTLYPVLVFQQLLTAYFSVFHQVTLRSP